MNTSSNMVLIVLILCALLSWHGLFKDRYLDLEDSTTSDALKSSLYRMINWFFMFTSLFLGISYFGISSQENRYILKQWKKISYSLLVMLCLAVCTSHVIIMSINWQENIPYSEDSGCVMWQNIVIAIFLTTCLSVIYLIFEYLYFSQFEEEENKTEVQDIEKSLVPIMPKKTVFITDLVDSSHNKNLLPASDLLRDCLIDNLKEKKDFKLSRFN